MTDTERADDLSDALTDTEHPDETGEYGLPRDLIHVDWHARRAARARNELEQIATTAAVMRARIDEWVERSGATISARLERHEQAIRAYHAHVLRYDPTARTIELPTGGRLRTQAGKLSVVVVDEATFVAWAAVNLPEAVRTKRSADRTVAGRALAYKAKAEHDPGEYAAVTADGEVAPGIVMSRGERRYYVDLPDAEPDRTDENPAEAG